MTEHTLTVALAQLNPTIGDFAGNQNKVTAAMTQASAQGADLLVLSELVLTGYYPGDLLESPEFLHAAAAALDAVLTASRAQPGLVTVLGTVRPNTGPGKPLHNALLAIRDGHILLEYHKQLLPTYNVFDERRHFEPGHAFQRQVLELNGIRVGFLICEDGWNLEGDAYPVNPLAALRQARPALVVSINASPANLGKREERHALFQQAATWGDFALVYVNQVGGQDQLVFDGASFAVEPAAGVVAEAASFAEDFQLLSYTAGHFAPIGGGPLPQPSLTPWPAPEFTHQLLVLGLRDYARRCGFHSVVVGSSGGIDSALTLALAVDALGPGQVTAITMPSAFSSVGSVEDSRALCDNLGIRLVEHPIRDLVATFGRGFAASFGQPLAGLPLENVQARIRGTILMEYSNAFGALLLTTGNKSELSVGYATLYGDTNGGLGLLGDLYKTEVYALAAAVNAWAGTARIPPAILTKAPSAELAPGQRDTDSLPPYPVLDALLQWHLERATLPTTEYRRLGALVAELQRNEPATVAKVLALVARSEYKRRQAPPVLRVRARAFGAGRQLPIAAQHPN